MNLVPRAVLSLVLTACATSSVEQVTSGDIEAGRAVFVASCAECHGVDAMGTDTGPPLVHDVYESGHHSDESFLVAVRRGVPAHHWDFGPMEPIDGISDEDVANIVAYVRDLQLTAGIE